METLHHIAGTYRLNPLVDSKWSRSLDWGQLRDIKIRARTKSPSRRCHDNMRLLPQSNSLLHVVHTSYNKSTSERDQRSQSLEGLCDLDCEFSRRCKNETEEGLWFLKKLLQDGKCECDSLS
jgi:hypothetical protein